MKYVALLRGINVGGRTVRMAELRSCLENLGLHNVSTYIQSGNVVFESSIDDPVKLRAAIEKAVGEHFGYSAAIHVYQAGYVGQVVADYPFKTADVTMQYHVVFMDNGLAKSLAQAATDLDPSVETIKLGDGVIYWKVKKGFTVRGQFSKHQAKASFRLHATVRTVQTLQKLLDMV